MKRNLLFTLVLIVCSMTAFSQKWIGEGVQWYNVPSYFIDDPELCVINLTKDMPCNKGSEPFSTFLDKFNNDASFRASRCASSEYTYYFTDKSMLEFILNDISDAGGFPIKGYSKKVGYDKEYKYDIYEWGFWCYIDSDSIVYSTIYNADKNYGFLSLFQRIDDKWYCTDASPTNELFNHLME